LRFTKGDIVVQVPGKLPFFDFTHKHALLRETPPNMPLIQSLFVDPVEKGINEFLATQQASSDPASATSGESGPRMHPRAAAAYSAETGRIVDPEFFLDLVRQLADYGLNMGNVAQKTRHLIWEIPFENLRNAMTTSRAEDSAPGAPFVIETAAILDLVRRKLELVGPESWTADRLREVLKGEVEPEVSAALALEGVRDPEPRNSQDQPPVRSIHTPLRRALLGNDSGPKNVDVMVFLGREESLKRLKTAADMARKLAYQPDWEPEKGFTWKKMEPPSGTRPRAPPSLGLDTLDEGGERRSKVIRRIPK
jgi:glutamyl-tRNA synthetase